MSILSYDKVIDKSKPKSKLIIGKESRLVVYTEQKFNKLQKKMWKFLLGIKIEDIKEEEHV